MVASGKPLGRMLATQTMRGAKRMVRASTEASAISCPEGPDAELSLPAPKSIKDMAL